MARPTDWILDRPAVVLGAFGLAVLALAGPASQLRSDASLQSLLPGNDPAIAAYEEMRAIFGSDDLGVIGVFADDVYAGPVLETVDRITKSVAALEGIDDVLSLTNATDPVTDVTAIPPMVPKIPTTAAESAALRDKVESRPIVVPHLVSRDGKATGINLFFEDRGDGELLRLGVDEAIAAIVASESRPGIEVHYTGLPHFRLHSVRAMWSDLARILPLAFGAIVIVLFLSFRSARGVLLPLLSAGGALVCTLGAMSLFGRPLSLGNVALPPLIVVIGAVYALHVIAEYLEQARPGRSPREAVGAALGDVGAASLLTAITTVIGFLALTVNAIEGIRDLGFFAALGIVFAYLFAVAFVPAALVLMPIPRRPVSPRLGNRLRALGEWVLSRRRLVVISGAGFVAIALSAVPAIRADTNFLSFYRAEDPIRVATEAINEGLGGAMGFSVIVSAREAGSFRRWDTLRALRDLQGYLVTLDGVDATLSFADYVELLDRGAQRAGGITVNEAGEVVEIAPRDDAPTLWENPAQLGAAISLVSTNPAAFSRVVDPKFQHASVLVRTSLARSGDVAALVQEIERYAGRHLPPGLEANATGNLVLLTRSSQDVVRGQVWSLALASAAIFVLVSGFFLSLRIGAIAMIPNLFPIAAFFGLMGATGVDLNLGTSVIAAIALGIAVDDTVHVLTRLSSEVRRDPCSDCAIADTLGVVGKPVLFTTAILVPGFLAMTVSSFVPVFQFGLLTAVTMIFALLGDLVLLPALVGSVHIITLWDLLRLRLGDAPHKTIPLFAGLRAWQARIVALVGELADFDTGQAIVRQGERGREMYVLLDGSADVVIHSDSGARRVRQLGRGDAFGEMALVRAELRSADVIATSPVEVLMLGEGFLDRLLRRYPFTANKVLLNVARILGDRLGSETMR